MVSFKIDVQLIFDELNISSAKDRLDEIEKLLSDGNVKLNITDRLFGNGKD